jgi:hypothetical protein
MRKANPRWNRAVDAFRRLPVLRQLATETRMSGPHGAVARGRLLESWPGIPKGNFRVSPRCPTDLAPIARDYATMRTLAVIFVLALVTIAFEVYSDASLVSGDISHIAAPDPATAAIAHGFRLW